MGLDVALNQDEEEMIGLRLIKLLTIGSKKGNEIKKILGLNTSQFNNLKTKLRDSEFNINYDRNTKQYYVGETPSYQMSAKELELQTTIKEMGLNGDEAKFLLNQLKNVNTREYKPYRIKFSDWEFKTILSTDYHFGHKEYRPDALAKMAEIARREDLKFVLNSGDTLEGVSGRDGHIYELDYIGMDNQIDYAAEQLQPFADAGIKLLSIEATNSHTGWYNSKGNAGIDVGKIMEKRIPAYKFLGWDDQKITLDNGLTFQLTHPGGGTAYAISYKMQKYIESLSGGQKPHIVSQGHFHKMNYMFYRNVHCFDAGCLQNQSIFLRKKRSPAHVGFWNLKVYYDKELGVERVVPEMVAFYE